MMPATPPIAPFTMQRVRFWLLSASIACLPACAAAQMFSDAALQAAHLADNFAELQRAGTTRVAARPDDAQAVLALAIAATADGSPATSSAAAAAAARKAVMGHAEACLEKNPKAFECHYALGVTLGLQSMSEGMLKAAGNATRVRTALQDAHLLAPHWYPARSALLEFYLQAPGLMGGSRSKARELAQAAPAPAQRVLLARVADAEGDSERALRELLGHRFGGLPEVDDDARGWAQAAAFQLLNKGQPLPVVKTWFERVETERPVEAMGPYGLARVHAESGQHAEAVAAYERSARLKGAERLPVDYRLGISLQALGRKEAARTALQRFVSAGRGNQKALADARKRLDELGG